MSNDSKSNGLPPSVGEFAIEDRQRLLDRIAELEEALELADRGVANCEVFRQRLAKYEDAEGRPVGLSLGQAELVVQLRKDSESIDTDKIEIATAMLEAAEALESQAREIVRLNSEAMYSAAAYAAACEEIDRLKIHPSRVVLPERVNENEGNSYSIMQAMARNQTLDEVARLNSSLISDDELGDAYQGAREDLAIWKRRALEAETKVREKDQIIDHLTLEAQGETRFGEPAISAGVVDERAREALRKIMEAHRFNVAGMTVTEVHAICFDALTDPAPNRSEQVREGWQPSGIEYDRSIHHNPDAKAWADLFVATFPALADKHDLMLGWFANAMMAMHDFLKAQQPNGEVLDWAVERWHAEVSQRPLINVHRRSLDGTWRQIIRKLGGDPVDLCGPDHDTLLAAAPSAGSQGKEE